MPGVEIFLVGIRPFSLDFLDRYLLYDEETYSLDDKEENPNIPFYDFNLSDEILKVGDELINIFNQLFKRYA